MLGKLFKYEIKATARLFLPLYLTIIIVAAINMLFLNTPDAGEKSTFIGNIAMGVSIVTYVTLIVGMLLMTLIVLVQRFHKNLLGDEGYLMFTLPVQPWCHILSKLFVSMLWTIVSGIVAFCSILLIAAKDISWPDLYNELSFAFSHMEQYFGSLGFLVGIEAILLGLFTLSSTILTIYAAIALGHLFNRYKLLASFGMYIALDIVSQILMSVFGFVFFNQYTLRLGYEFIPNASHVSGFMLISIIYTGLVTAVYFILTNYLLKKKLNLE